MRMIAVLASAASLAASTAYGYEGGPDAGYGAAHGGGYGPDRYEGSAWAARRGRSPLRGPGADVLDPWLAETDEGRALVRTGWRDARDGRIGRETAHRANVWFRRHADADRDMCLTDDEIRNALAWGAVHQARYSR